MVDMMPLDVDDLIIEKGEVGLVMDKMPDDVADLIIEMGEGGVGLMAWLIS